MIHILWVVPGFNAKGVSATQLLGWSVLWGYSMKLLGSPLRGLIVNSGMHRIWTWSSQVTDPNSVLKCGSQGCPAIPWSRPDHVLPRHYSCATNMGEFLGSVYHWQSSSSLLQPRKSIKRKRGAKKSSCNEQRSNTQVKIRYNMVWRHWSPIILYFQREEAEFSKVNSKIVIYRLNATPQCMF